MPKLKAFYEKKEDVPGDLVEFYEEQDGKMALQVDGPQGGVSEAEAQRLRTAMTRAKAERDEARKALKPFEGFKNADEVHAQLDELAQLRAEKETSGEKNDAAQEKVIAARVARETAPLKRELDAAKAENTRLTSEAATSKADLVNTKIENELAKFIPASGIKDEGAIRDLLHFAKSELTVGEDGKVTTKDGIEGLPLAMDAKTWLNQHVKTARAYLWPDSKGAGAGGGNGGSSYAGANPWAKGKENYTEQAKLVKTDPALAKRLSDSAGVPMLPKAPGFTPAVPAKA